MNVIKLQRLSVSFLPLSVILINAVTQTSYQLALFIIATATMLYVGPLDITLYCKPLYFYVL